MTTEPRTLSAITLVLRAQVIAELGDLFSRPEAAFLAVVALSKLPLDQLDQCAGLQDGTFPETFRALLAGTRPNLSARIMADCPPPLPPRAVDEDDALIEVWTLEVDAGLLACYGISIKDAGLDRDQLVNGWQRHPLPGDFVRNFGRACDLIRLDDPWMGSSLESDHARQWLHDHPTREASELK